MTNLNDDDALERLYRDVKKFSKIRLFFISVGVGFLLGLGAGIMLLLILLGYVR